MTLRKTTVDNSVNYIPQSEQTQFFQEILNQTQKRKFHFLENRTRNCHKKLRNSLKISY